MQKNKKHVLVFRDCSILEIKKKNKIQIAYSSELSFVFFLNNYSANLFYGTVVNIQWILLQSIWQF